MWGNSSPPASAVIGEKVMTEGRVTYTSRLEGIEFDPVECRADHPSVSKIELSAKGGDMTYIVHLSGVSGLDEALAIASSEVARVVNLLSVNLGVSITEPRLTEHALSRVELDVTGKQIFHAHVGNMLTMMTSAYAVKKLGGASLNALRQALSDATPPGEANFVLFRSAVAATDPASRFLGLYQILALLNGDNQDQIDAFILGHEPGTPVTRTRPKKDGLLKDETIYTRLRNEYAHIRPGVSLAQTRKEMDANLSSLIAIVQAAIKSRRGVGP
jgi:hypothetical protein